MKRNLFFLLIIFTLIYSSGFYVEQNLLKNFKNRRTDIKDKNIPLFSFSKTNNSTIIITDNSEFTLNGFHGNGTIDNPYYVDNLSINDESEILISISNTNVFFIIKNSILDGFYGEFEGINLNNVSNGQIINNTITRTSTGIKLTSSSNIFIENNTIFDNSESSLYLNHSSNNSLSSNLLSDNSLYGVYLFHHSYNNCVFNNKLYNCEIGIYLTDYNRFNIIENNSIKNNFEGIFLTRGCQYNEIINNSINYNHYGIHLYISTYNIIESNLIFSNILGIYIEYYGYSTIIKNNFIFNNSNYGLKLGNNQGTLLVRYCQISWNSFINNNYLENKTSQAFDNREEDGSDSTNNFSFNYWSEWTFIDVNHDGIVDEPYSIEGSNTLDLYPLSSNNKSVEYHFLTEPILYIPIYDQNSRFVTIYWNSAIDSFNIPISFALYYSTNFGIDWNELIFNTYGIFYSWNSSTIEIGCYKLKIVATNNEGLSTEFVTDNFPLKMDHTLSFPKFLSPDFNKTLSGNVTIQWSPAIDNCYYLITYNLSYSVDGGNMWILLASNLNTTFFEWDTSTVSSGVNYRLKIVAISFSGLISTTILDQSFTINNDELYLFIKSFPFIELLFITIILFELFFLNFLIRFIKIKTKVTNK